MYAEYKRDVSHNYLILHGEAKVDTSSYQVRMLTGNKIPSILKCRLQGLDGNMMFYYDITSRQSVSSFYEHKKLRGEDLDMLLRGFIRVMEDMAEFLLNVEQLVLCPEYIFLDIEKREVSFCCLPDYGHPVQDQFRELTEYFLPKLDHEDPEAVSLGYEIYRKAMEPGMQLEHIKETVYRFHSGPKESDGVETPAEDPVSEPEIPKAEQEISDNIRKEERKAALDEEKKVFSFSWELFCVAAAMLLFAVVGASYLGYLPEIPVEIVIGAAIGLLGVSSVCTWFDKQNEKKKEQSAEWRQKVKKEQEKQMETSLYEQPAQAEKYEKEKPVPTYEKEQYGETVVLSAGALQGPASLVSREPGELAPIYLEQDLVVIGKLEHAADAVIALPTVSRIHARIRKTGEDYYLADLNSRNGTTVNGRLLKPGEEYLLQDEDQVDFAQARYVFLNTKTEI